ncbi:hypothetical protein RHMOL_Rhmol07G0168700 [Rhododendron molle]|uniref:Uncharacterized protein n=1 Tax=Rhododendron molle TaxID=49168 RepID=A0ACC0N1H5_RHOML|nr:hypothetical protein RHMOL_Rhmol07G0168700 [Rhododendron molle]
MGLDNFKQLISRVFSQPLGQILKVEIFAMICLKHLRTVNLCSTLFQGGHDIRCAKLPGAIYQSSQSPEQGVTLFRYELDSKGSRKLYLD